MSNVLCIAAYHPLQYLSTAGSSFTKVSDVFINHRRSNNLF
jgi:hypothetical protein